MFLRSLAAVIKKRGFKVNREKTKYLISSLHRPISYSHENIEPTFHIDVYDFKVACAYKYMGNEVNSGNNITVEVKWRIKRYLDDFSETPPKQMF